jgi:peptide/nickel transport system substrate-binding protein
VSYISRWNRSAIASNLTLTALALSAALALPAPAPAKTITAVMHSDLRTIDP